MDFRNWFQNWLGSEAECFSILTAPFQKKCSVTFKKQLRGFSYSEWLPQERQTQTAARTGRCSMFEKNSQDTLSTCHVVRFDAGFQNDALRKQTCSVGAPTSVVLRNFAIDMLGILLIWDLDSFGSAKYV